MINRDLNVIASSRVVPVTEFLPEDSPIATIVFSPGAFSNKDAYDPILSAWAKAGFRVVSCTHVDGLSKDAHDHVAIWKTRLEDIETIIEKLVDGPVIFAGHSFGALAAQVFAGAQVGPMFGNPEQVINNLVGCVALSPPPATPGLMTDETWATMQCPYLVQTGTTDVLPGFCDNWEGHRASFDNGAGARYLVVYDGVDHYFGGAICRDDVQGPKQTEPLDKFVQLSLSFLNACLEGNGDDWQPETTEFIFEAKS